MTRSCNYCGVQYSRRPSVVGKYCSKTCMGKDNACSKSRANLTHRIPKGSIPWNKGVGRTIRECLQCSNVLSVLVSQGTKFCNKSCYDSYQTNNRPTNYGGIHSWMRRHFGTPSQCEHCGTSESPKFEWANLSGEYRLDRSDWMRLCCSCHRKYDLGTKNKLELVS